MSVSQCGARCGSRVAGYLVIGAAIVFTPVGPVSAKQWDRKGAQKAFEEAKRLQFDLHEHSSPPPSREKYLQCIRTFQRVYLKDPHYGGSDDAAYEAATLYQEMGEKFPAPVYFKNAAKLYRFLVSDYPRSRHCPDALLHLGDLYSGPLKDRERATEIYEELRTRFKSSEAAAIVSKRDTIPVPSPQPKQSGVSESNIKASVQNIRHWSTSDYTRIIIDLDNETQYQKTRLSDPDRIYFDISPANLNSDLGNKTFFISDEFLKKIRVGQNRPEVVRVVLDFANISDYAVFELHDPFRIVIDIHGARTAAARAKKPSREVSSESEEVAESKKTRIPPAPVEPPAQTTVTQQVPSNAKNAPVARKEKPQEVTKDSESAARTATVEHTPAPATTKPESTKKASVAEKTAQPSIPPNEKVVVPKAAAPTSRGNRTLTRELGLKIGRIVLDPGHGGFDTGSIGHNGLKEKDLVLQVAHRLKKYLEERLGAQVVLTRTDDTFIALEERTAIANQHQADLFISIHANSSRIRTASGVETYYLDFAHTEDAREIAARENATTVRNVRDLQELVKRITQADKSAESRELASIIQKKLYVGAHQVFPTPRNRGVRSAPFVVLIGANMPSVLAEVGFISNPRDEKLLKKEDNRNRLAEALFAGIEGYMKTLGSDVAQNQSN